MLDIHAEILMKGGKKQFAVLPYEEFVQIQQLLADAEDLLELRKAKRAEGRKPGVSIAEAKRKLGLA